MVKWPQCIQCLASVHSLVAMSSSKITCKQYIMLLITDQDHVTSQIATIFISAYKGGPNQRQKVCIIAFQFVLHSVYI